MVVLPFIHPSCLGPLPQIHVPTMSVPLLPPRETTVKENLAVLGALACLVLQGRQAQEEKR